MYFKSVQYTFTSNFGLGRAGHTVTCSVLDNTGAPSANATVGSVVELSDGCYGVTITFTASFNGYIKWVDTNDSIELYQAFISIDDYRSDITAIKKVELNRWKIYNHQLVIYDDDDSTPLYTFDLKKEDVADGENPDERVPA